MLRRRFCFCVLCALAAVLAYLLLFTAKPADAAAPAALPAAVAPEEAQPGKPVSFINDVAPILKENCFACHDAKKKAGKFDMTSYEKLMAGGANGEQITP